MAEVVASFQNGTTGQVLTATTGSAPSFQDPAVTGASLIHPWSVLNSGYYTVIPPVTTTSSVLITANRLYLCPFYNPSDTTISEIGIYVKTFSSATNVRFGIYDQNSSGEASSLVVDLGVVAVSGTGFNTISGLSQALPSGYYYFAFVGDTGGFNYGYSTGLKYTLFTNDANAADGGYVAFVYAALPASVSTPYTRLGNQPLVVLK